MSSSCFLPYHWQSSWPPIFHVAHLPSPWSSSSPVGPGALASCAHKRSHCAAANSSRLLASAAKPTCVSFSPKSFPTKSLSSPPTSSAPHSTSFWPKPPWNFSAWVTPQPSVGAACSTGHRKMMPSSSASGGGSSRPASASLSWALASPSSTTASTKSPIRVYAASHYPKSARNRKPSPPDHPRFYCPASISGNAGQQAASTTA